MHATLPKLARSLLRRARPPPPTVGDSFISLSSEQNTPRHESSSRRATRDERNDFMPRDRPRRREMNDRDEPRPYSSYSDRPNSRQRDPVQQFNSQRRQEREGRHDQPSPSEPSHKRDYRERPHERTTENSSRRQYERSDRPYERPSRSTHSPGDGAQRGNAPPPAPTYDRELSYAVYADRGLALLDKPPGLVCQGDGEPMNSRNLDGFDRILRNTQRDLSTSGPLYPVHRLDKGTTGALLLARTPALARDLSQQFSSRSIEKSYLALVRGGAKSFNGKTEGTINAALAFVDGRVKLAAAAQKAPSETKGKSGKEKVEVKEASTSWELLASSEKAPLSLVRLHLHTGLKHQLRVHTAHVLKAPILGDTLYAKTGASDLISQLGPVAGRTFLHASSVGLWRYRKTAKQAKAERFRLTLTAPLPRDFVRLCRSAGIALERVLSKEEVVGGVLVDGTPTDEEVEGIEGRWLL